MIPQSEANIEYGFKSLKGSLGHLSGLNIKACQFLEVREALLSLRFKTYAEVTNERQGEVGIHASKYDSSSLHIVATEENTLLAALRLNPVGKAIENSEYVGVGGHKVPVNIAIEGFCEIGAGVVRKNVRGTGLITALISKARDLAVRDGYKFMLGACPKAMEIHYQKMGFRKLEEKWVEAKPGWTFNSSLHVMDL